MIVRAALALSIAIAAFGGGYLLGGKHTPPTRTALSCTPSAPKVVAASAQGPVALFWGNSLLHDHHWSIDGVTSINCAVQGLTAAAAAPMVPSLPDVNPDFIVIAFGSVELIRAGGVAALNENAFAQAVAENLAVAQARWPEARLILASAPSFSGMGDDRRIDLSAAEVLNDALARVAEEDARLSYFELGLLYNASAGELPRDATYDGVHLTPAAYQLWQAALSRRMGAP